MTLTVVEVALTGNVSAPKRNKPTRGKRVQRGIRWCFTIVKGLFGFSLKASLLRKR
jgi:hypothetical protein